MFKIGKITVVNVRFLSEINLNILMFCLNKMVDKKGQVGWKPFLWIGGIVVFILGAWMFLISDYGAAWTSTLSIDTEVNSFGNTLGDSFAWLDFVFGGVPKWLDDRVGETSAVIITILVFLLLFITFGDIFQQFSSFSPPIAWVSALFISGIAANLKAIVVIIGFFVGIFAFLGGLAVVVGLFASFVAFFAVNWGIGSLGPWVMRRKAMMHAQKNAIATEAGAINVAAAVKGMKRIGKSLASNDSEI